MDDNIHIPNANEDQRIGYVFNDLFNVIARTENCKSNDVVWNFKNDTFFHPFFVAPLALYKKFCKKNIRCEHVPSNIKSYFETIYFDKLFVIEDDEFLDEKLKPYLRRSYLPICEFSLKDKTKVDKIQSILQQIIENQSKADYKIKNPLAYMLGELICNIGEHSQSEYGYVYSQVLRDEGYINLCIADKGINIYGSYKSTGKYMEEIGKDQAKALQLANEGYSTKDRPHAESRGFGISTTKKMLVEGLGGSIFMLSGGAFHRYDLRDIKKTIKYVNLPPIISWKGTIILMKIPINIPKDFDFYKYTKE